MTKAIENSYYKNNFTNSKKPITPFDAIVLNNYEMFVNLLTIDFNVDLRNDSRQTLLMVAIQEEHVPMIRCLINHNADLYLMDDNFDMAEDYAKVAKNKDILKILLCRIKKEEFEFAKAKKSF